MKPQLLKITGINSFNEEQILDFSKLKFDGIFGIFGDTGSGKSTIIDAITLALYGKIVRHKSKNKNGDFINLNRKTAVVEFQFSINENSKRRNYSVFRQFKKDKEGKVKGDIVRFLDLDNDKILSDTKTELEEAIINTIGLNYDDFTKAVVLPQGKFSEFLLLENIEKRKMLERIFGLEKYGDKLTKKINSNKAIKQREVDSLKDKIQNYKDLTPNLIQEKKQLLAKEEENIKTEETTLDKILQQENSLKLNIDLKKEYETEKDALGKILPYKSRVEEMKMELEKSKKSNILKPYILDKDFLSKEKIQLEKEYAEIKKHYNDTQDKYLLYNEKYQKIYEAYKNDLPSFEKTKTHLQNCIKLNKEKQALQQEIHSIKNKLSEKKLLKDSLQKDLNIIIEEKNKIQYDIKNLEDFKNQNKVDIDYKKDLEQYILCIKEIENIENCINDNNSKINLQNENINENKQVLLKNKHSKQILQQQVLNILLTNRVSLNKELQEIFEKKQTLNIKIKNVKKEIAELDIQIKIQENKEFVQELTKKLTEGSECPICGSLEHPNPAEVFLDIVLSTLFQKKEQLILDIENFQKNYENLIKSEVSVKKYIDDIEIHLKNFNIEDIEQSLQEECIINSNQLFSYIEDKNKKIIHLNEENTKCTERIKNIEKNIQGFLKENETYLQKIKDKQDYLKNVKEKLQIQDFLTEYNKLVECEKINIIKEEKLNKYREYLKDISEKEEDFKKLFYENEKNLICINTSLKEKSLNLQNILDDIKNDDYTQDFENQLKHTLEKINNIINQEKDIKVIYEKVCTQKEYITTKFENIKTKMQINTKTLQEKEQKFQQLLIEKNIKEDEILCLDQEEEKFRETKIASFEEKINIFKINLDRASEKFFNLNNINIEYVNLSEMENEFENLTEKKCILEDTKNKRIYAKTRLDIEINKLEKDLIHLNELQKIFKDELKKLDILEELSKLNNGGIFVEYVANRQLYHIVLDASKRLENMSNNKYSLNLVNNTFVIKDNYNGGITRSTRSLSGGELFMASLSLALALSSKIQLKNKAPLEIFFLDEGFGTLDSMLLDTVINTLEELKINNIDVGLITHLDEIKNRIHNKVIIKKDNSGATINIL